MPKPRRIQRKRTKGWRMPPNTVYVGRPTVFANIWSARQLGQRRAVEMFRAWLAGERLRDYLPDGFVIPISALLGLDCARDELLRRLPELRGKNLCCWCPLDQSCHVDVLLEMANTNSAQVSSKSALGGEANLEKDSNGKPRNTDD